MKIVFVNSCAYLGGAELWHLRAAQALAQRGHRVAMLLRPGPLADKAREAGLDVTTLSMSFDLDAISFFRAWRYFSERRPDLILLNDQRECRLIAPAAALAGVKVRLQRKGWPFLKGSWRDRMVYRHFVTHLMAASREIARVFEQKSGLPAERIRVLTNGLDLARFATGNRAAVRARYAIPDDAALIGSAGRLVTQKGFDVLIAALGLIPAEKNFRLLIAGQGPERERLLALARDSGIADRVLLPGQIDDVPSLLASLDLFVSPSRQEGRSNAIMEALAAGKPIIATKIPGTDELIADGQTGLLVPADDPEALAGAITRLLADRGLAARLGAAGRSFAERELDQEKIIAELEAYLEGLIKCS